MRKNTTVREYLSISLKELRILVTDLCGRQPQISIRYRLVGEMWYHNFLKILQVDENGMTLLDEASEKRISIRELASIIQFELDSGFRSFEPHCPYDVATGRQFVLF